MNGVDEKYYINVQELMIKALPRPRLKPVIIVNDGEWLPIIKVNAWR